MKTPAPGGQPEREGEKSAGRHDDFAHSAPRDANASIIHYGRCARLYVLQQFAPYPHVVAFGSVQAEPSTDPERGTSGLACLIHQPAGLSWPDANGLRLAAACLTDEVGVVLLAFESLADALQCHARLRAVA